MRRKGYSTVEMMLVLALIAGFALYSGKKLSETNKDVTDGPRLKEWSLVRVQPVQPKLHCSSVGRALKTIAEHSHHIKPSVANSMVTSIRRTMCRFDSCSW